MDQSISTRKEQFLVCSKFLRKQAVKRLRFLRGLAHKHDMSCLDLQMLEAVFYVFRRIAEKVQAQALARLSDICCSFLNSLSVARLGLQPEHISLLLDIIELMNRADIFEQKRFEKFEQDIFAAKLKCFASDAPVKVHNEVFFQKVADSAGLSDMTVLFKNIYDEFFASDGISHSDVHSKLDNFYWICLEAVLASHLRRSLSEDVDFILEERLLIDYGLLDEQFYPEDDAIKKLIEHFTHLKCLRLKGVDVLSITGLIESVNRRLLNLDHKDRLTGQIDDIQGHLKVIRKKLAALRNSRHCLQDGAQNAEYLASIDHELEQIGWYMLELEYEKCDPDNACRVNERIEQFKKRVEFLRQTKQCAVEQANSELGDAIRQLDNQIMELSAVFVKLGYNMHDIISEIFHNSRQREEYLLTGRYEDIVKVSKTVRGVSNSVSYYSGCLHNPALFDGFRVFPPEDLEKSWTKLLELDPHLLELIPGSSSLPIYLVVFPGNGMGVYCAQLRAFFVPVLQKETVFHSLACAAAQLRWQSSTNLSGEYPSRKKTAARDAEKGFIDDYISYMCGLTGGKSGLEPELSDWFSSLLCRR